MNHLLGIEHDKDVRQIPPPPQDDFNLYEDDLGGPGPSIHPMTPFWENLRCEWNYWLYKLFIEYLKAPAPDGHGIHLDNENHTEIQGALYTGPQILVESTGSLQGVYRDSNSYFPLSL